MLTGKDNDLGLTDSSCACAHDSHPDVANASHTADSGFSRTFQVAGMTCSHCVASVTTEVGKVAGAARVNVDLVPGGLSMVTVSSSSPVDPAAIAAAIDEAGYELTLETP
ncbi:cation transporter [Cryobacterium sp. SO2]|uniref:heavy-metal-associated domain-containing protein n=1 Tax=Cryobacterium sp. SO2 TaxID=1897060 RepID=UPI00223DB4BF|nr:cation transporter [Cryobacterium sp. SO2]WEO76048.1 cation transporter [Cryobacterium sp. SO2]